LTRTIGSADDRADDRLGQALRERREQITDAPTSAALPSTPWTVGNIIARQMAGGSGD
jgi:hypothetical protein